MLRLSRKTLLTVEAVLDIAFYGRLEPVQAKAITDRQGVPQRYLEQAMQHLVHEGVLKGVRGPRGGYSLARERRRITISEIVQLISQMEAAQEAAGTSPSDLGRQVVGPLWEVATEKFMQELSAITIEDLCRQAAKAGVKRPDQQKSDFTI